MASRIPKIIEQWLLFKYVEGEFTLLSKPFKTKAAAERALGVLKCGQTAVRSDLRADWELLIFPGFISGAGGNNGQKLYSQPQEPDSG